MRSRRKLKGSNKRAAKKTAFRVEEATIAGVHRAFRAKQLTATELVQHIIESGHMIFMGMRKYNAIEVFYAGTQHLVAKIGTGIHHQGGPGRLHQYARS